MKILVILIAIISIITICLYFFKRKNINFFINEIYLKLSEEIKFSVAPKFIDMSQPVNDLVELAVEIWRMENRVKKCLASIQENQQAGLQSSIQKLKRYLDKCDIEIIDYTGQKFNDGLNLDVLSVEKNPENTHPIVKETIEPTIMCKGQVVRKAKIILITA